MTVLLPCRVGTVEVGSALARDWMIPCRSARSPADLSETQLCLQIRNILHKRLHAHTLQEEDVFKLSTYHDSIAELLQ